MDPFYKQLANKQRNLAKKMKRITEKQKQRGKALDPSEVDLLNSKQQVEDALAETSRLLEQYQKYSQNPPKKPEDNKKAELLDLWLVGEFLKNPESLHAFKQAHPDDTEVDLFLAFYSTVRGETGQTFSSILSDMQNSMSLYLSKSDKVVPGIMRTYKNISEFTNSALSWCMTQKIPLSASKATLAMGTTSSFQLSREDLAEDQGDIPQDMPETVIEEAPPEPVIEEVVEELVKSVAEPPAEVEKGKPKLTQKAISSWAEQEDDWLSPLNSEATNEGFTEVIKKRKKKDDGFEKVDSKKNLRRGRRPR